MFDAASDLRPGATATDVECIGRARFSTHSTRTHLHLERNHQGAGNRLLTPTEQAVRAANGNAPVEHRVRLGGLLSVHHRRAA